MRAEELQTLAKSTLCLLAEVKVAITQASTDFSTYFDRLTAYMQSESGESKELANRVLEKATFFMVADDQFATVEQMLDDDQAKPSSGALGNAGYYMFRLQYDLKDDKECPEKIKDVLMEHPFADYKYDTGTWVEVSEFLKTKLMQAAD